MTHKVIETELLKIIPQDDPKQVLRLHRFFMASAIYILSWLLTYIFYLANIMDWESVFVCLIGIPLINVILYIVFRTGLNLRMSDPSLTSIQICTAILVMMYGMYYANEARGLLMLIYVPILLFGIFRLQTRQFLFLSVFVLLTYGTDIALFHVFNPPRVNFKIEYLQWSVLSIVLVILSFMGGYISSIRQNLSTSRAELEKSVSLIKAEVEERKTTEEALRQNEEKYRSILEDMQESYFEVDLAGNFTFFNDSVCILLGYSREELMGMNNRQFTDKEYAKKLFQAFNEVYNTGIPTKAFDWQIIRKDGTKRYVEASVSSRKNSSGQPIGFRGVSRDITERKQAEEEKRILEERLRQADKMEAIGTLAGGIAHDFNNLLMGIQGYTSMTLLNLDPGDKNRERLKRIEDQVQSGSQLTKQLLGFARGGRYEVKPANMNEILEKSSSLFGRTKKEITIHKQYENDLFPVEIDLGQMEQVFMNLFVNAWQAMPGGGNIFLETENVLLDDKQALTYTVKPGRYIKVSVTDTGIGMDEKTKERIFDPFFTTKAMGRGTGLGLATVYGIINGHKGMINVYSEPGNGTTFTIYLPASEMEVVKEKAETGSIMRGSETVMLVDDEKMVLEANKEMLEFLGYKVYEVGSGQEAIAAYMEKRNEIDLVILDMIMPGISGGETFDHLREINPRVKVLLSSGYSLAGEALTIMERGCGGFLQKPFHLAKLSQKVREMLD